MFSNFCFRELKNYDAVMINQILCDLGFMCNINNKMYTMQPSKIYFFQKNTSSSDDLSLLKLDVCIFCLFYIKRKLIYVKIIQILCLLLYYRV